MDLRRISSAGHTLLLAGRVGGDLRCPSLVEPDVQISLGFLLKTFVSSYRGFGGRRSRHLRKFAVSVTPTVAGRGAVDDAFEVVRQSVAEMPVNLAVRFARTSARKSSSPSLAGTVQPLNQVWKRGATRGDPSSLSGILIHALSFDRPSSTVPRSRISLSITYKSRSQRNVPNTSRQGLLDFSNKPARARILRFNLVNCYAVIANSWFARTHFHASSVCLADRSGRTTRKTGDSVLLHDVTSVSVKRVSPV